MTTHKNRFTLEIKNTESHTMDDYLVEHKPDLCLHHYIIVGGGKVKHYLTSNDHMAILTWVKLTRILLDKNPNAELLPLYITPNIVMSYQSDWPANQFITRCLEPISAVAEVTVAGERLLTPVRDFGPSSVPHLINGKTVGIVCSPRNDVLGMPAHYYIHEGIEATFSDIEIGTIYK